MQVWKLLRAWLGPGIRFAQDAQDGGPEKDRAELQTARDEAMRAHSFLAVVLGRIPDMICYINPDYTYRYLNARALEWVGRTSEQVVSKHVRDVLGEEGYREVEASLALALVGKEASFERSYPRPDASIATVSVNCIPDLAADGTLLGIVVVGRDISAERRKDHALQASFDRAAAEEKRFRALFNKSPMGVVVVNQQDGRFLEVNDAFINFSGYGVPELRELSVFAITHPDDRDATKERYATFKSGDIYANIEKRYVAKSGEVVWGSVTSRRIESFGELKGPVVLSIIEDITRLKIGDLKLAAERAKNTELEFELKQILRIIDQSAVVVETDASGIITKVNENFLRSSGYSREEVLGHTHKLINSGTHPKEFFARMWQTILAGQVWSGEIRNRRKDGKHYWEQAFIGGVRNDAGDIIRFVAIRFDLTAQKSMQQALAYASKMSSLGEMAGGIAHEINNPLAIIQITAQALMKNVDSLEPKRLSSSLERIVTTTQRIAKIITGLRTFARNADLDPFNSSKLSSIIEDSFSLCREKFKINGIDLQLGTVPELQLMCRPTQLAQVLLNLFNNAMEAVESLPFKWVRLDVNYQAGKALELRVTDAGRGIPAELAEKIMQPFFTTKEVGKGTGLGLSIAKGLVEQHGGRLYLDPESTNTCFVIELPGSILVQKDYAA